MRYNSVDDAISDYKQAYGLMWDKRSINVRFRRKRGNTCLPEEPKLDVKKVKEEPSNAAQVEKERNANRTELELNVNELKEEENNTDEMKEDKINHADKSSINQSVDSAETRLQDNSNKAQRKPSSQVQENTNSHLAGLSTQEKQPWVIDIKSISLCCILLYHNCTNSHIVGKIYLNTFCCVRSSRSSKMKPYDVLQSYISAIPKELIIFLFSYVDITASSNTFSIGSCSIMSNRSECRRGNSDAYADQRGTHRLR